MAKTVSYRRVLWAGALTGAVGAFLPGCSDAGGGDDDDGGGASSGTGGLVPSTGGTDPWSGGKLPVPTGGAMPGATGGALTGGEPGLGGAPTGGLEQATGGAPPATGGAPSTGGVPTGGVPTGGVPTGGVPTGGVPTGGLPPETGGMATGGDPSTGGDLTGGVPSTGGAGACDGGPLDTSVPNCEIEVPPATGDYHQDCVDVINAWRWQCHCLPPLERWPEAEACADQMAEYDYGVQSAHAGFMANVCEPGGWGQCECPGWGSPESITHPQESGWGGERESCLEMMWHEVDNPAGEQGHYEAMSSTEYTRVACGIYVAPDGEVWAVQNYNR